MKNQKKKTKKKINQLNTYTKQVLETTEKIDYAQLLLKDLKPYISTSVNNFTKFKFQKLSDIIEEIQQDQIGFYMHTETELERMEQNATFAYKETLDNSYLDIIRESKNVITNTKHTYATIYGPK